MNSIKKGIMLGVVLVLMLCLTNTASAHSGVEGVPTRACSLGLSGISGNIRVDVGMDRDGDGEQDWKMELSMTHSQYRQLLNAKRNKEEVRITYQIDPNSMEYKVLDIVENDEGIYYLIDPITGDTISSYPNWLE